MSGVSCDSLTSAAALVLALILNPDLAVTAKPPAADPRSTPEAATLTAAKDGETHPSWRVGALAGIRAGALKSPSWQVALSLGAALGRFSLRLMPSLTPPQDVFIDDTQAKVGGRLWLATVATLGCWTSATGPVLLSPCFGVDLARLQGHGLGVVVAHDKTVYWTSAELAVFAGLPLGHGAMLEVGGVGLMPLGRPSVYLDGIGTVSRPAALGVGALAGLAGAFE